MVNNSLLVEKKFISGKKMQLQFIYFLVTLTPWSRVFLEKLLLPQLVNKFAEFYGTRRFLIMYTRARRLPLF
jgi:hypothetical protein